MTGNIKFTSNEGHDVQFIEIYLGTSGLLDMLHRRKEYKINLSTRNLIILSIIVNEGFIPVLNILPPERLKKQSLSFVRDGNTPINTLEDLLDYAIIDEQLSYGEDFDKVAEYFGIELEPEERYEYNDEEYEDDEGLTKHEILERDEFIHNTYHKDVSF